MPAQLGAQAIPPTGVAAPADGGTLLPGDFLRIAIWREPDLSGEFIVNPNGVVTLPLLGERSVTDVPIATLVRNLEEDFRKEIVNPSITIVPLRQIFLLGDVARPGLYSVPPATTLAGAVALAGGAGPLGDLDKISVFREGTEILNGVSMEDAIYVNDLRSSDQIYIGRISWLARNVTYVIGVGFTVFGIVMQFVR